MGKISFFKNLLNVMGIETNKSQNAHLSAKGAASMQQNYIENMNNETDTITPPYIEIVKQLNSTKEEIFKAAVYYLEKIVENESQYAKPITEALQQCRKKNKLSSENKRMLDSSIKKISER